MFLPWIKSKSARVYLDYAAATPLHPEVRAAMEPYLSGVYANPSAIHEGGRLAREAVEGARLRVARTLGVQSGQVVFTGSGTESNALAIEGYVRHLTEEAECALKDIEIISTAIEHPSVLKVLESLAGRGARVHYVTVDEEGYIDLTHLESLLTTQTVLLTFAYANSEIGTVQDVKRITRLVKKFNTENNASVKVHLDAAQAPLWLPCQVPRLGVDLMSLDAGKCQGPKGVGILANRNVPLAGMILGGGQEFGLRAGTENVPGIVGAAKALEYAQIDPSAPPDVRTVWDETNSHVLGESMLLLAELRAQLPELVLNGPEFELYTLPDGPGVSLRRLPNNINISLPGFDTEFAVVVLDEYGISASTKSACAGAGGGESSVVKTISDDSARAKSTIRFTLGPDTQLMQIGARRIASILRAHLDQMKTVTSKA